MIANLVRCEERLVFADGADIVLAGDILGHEDRDDAGHGTRSGRVALGDSPACVLAHHGPDLEHRAPARLIVDVVRASGDVTDRALVLQTMTGRRDVLELGGLETEELVLCEASFARPQFLEEARREIAAKARAAAGVADRRELAGEDGARSLHRRRAPRVTEERLLCAAGAHRRRRHAAEAEARMDDDVAIVQIDHHARSDDADIELTALGDLERVRDSTRRTGCFPAWNDHRGEDLVGLHRGLPVREEELGERKCALAARADEHDLGIEREEHGRRVPDRRCCDQVSRQGRSVSNLSRREHREHLAEGRELGAEGFLERRQGGRPADAKSAFGLLDPRELPHAVRRDQERKLAVLFVQVDADLGRAGDDHRIGMGGAKGEKIGERRGAEKALPLHLVVERIQGWLGATKRDLKEIRARRILLRERLDHRVANRPIASATTEIARELIVYLPALVEIAPIVGLEHGDHEPRRAIPALRAVVLHHRGLDGMKLFALTEAFHRDDLAPGHHGDERDAAVDGAIGALSARVLLDQSDGARPAIALSAAFFAPRSPTRTQKLKEGGGRRAFLYLHALAVEAEVEGRGHDGTS